jgi:hypothetical protein
LRKIPNLQGNDLYNNQSFDKKKHTSTVDKIDFKFKFVLDKNWRAPFSSPLSVPPQTHPFTHIASYMMVSITYPFYALFRNVKL